MNIYLHKMRLMTPDSLLLRNTYSIYIYIYIYIYVVYISTYIYEYIFA